MISTLLLLGSIFSVGAAEYQTFFLGGQSNMVGYGHNDALPEVLTTQQDVMIFHGNGALDNQQGAGEGVWRKVRPGHGTGFSSSGGNNGYSERFGAELSFAAALNKKLPDTNIAIIKYAVGGTGLVLNSGYGNWSPDFTEGEGNNQYDHALKTIQNAFAQTDIDGDGEADTLVPAGIIWMQGEADAHTSVHAANAYLTNLTRLMALLRASLRNDKLPIVVGKITHSGLEAGMMPFIERVQLAQQLFAKKDKCATFMAGTENYGYTKVDAWHYDSESYIEMGKDFADAYFDLVEQCRTDIASAVTP